MSGRYPFARSKRPKATPSVELSDVSRQVIESETEISVEAVRSLDLPVAGKDGFTIEMLIDESSRVKEDEIRRLQGSEAEGAMRECRKLAGLHLEKIKQEKEQAAGSSRKQEDVVEFYDPGDVLEVIPEQTSPESGDSDKLSSIIGTEVKTTSTSPETKVQMEKKAQVAKKSSSMMKRMKGAIVKTFASPTKVSRQRLAAPRTRTMSQPDLGTEKSAEMGYEAELARMSLKTAITHKDQTILQSLLRDELLASNRSIKMEIIAAVESMVAPLKMQMESLCSVNLKLCDQIEANLKKVEAQNDINKQFIMERDELIQKRIDMLEANICSAFAKYDIKLQSASEPVAPKGLTLKEAEKIVASSSVSPAVTVISGTLRTRLNSLLSLKNLSGVAIAARFPSLLDDIVTAPDRAAQILDEIEKTM